MATKYSKSARTSEEQKARRALSDEFWCAECEATGLVPICYVTRIGRVVEASCQCHCEAGVVLWEGSKIPTFKKASELELLNEAARTKHDHWIHQQRRSATLRGDDRMIALIDEVKASSNVSDVVRRYVDAAIASMRRL